MKRVVVYGALLVVAAVLFIMRASGGNEKAVVARMRRIVKAQTQLVPGEEYERLECLVDPRRCRDDYAPGISYLSEADANLDGDRDGYVLSFTLGPLVEKGHGLSRSTTASNYFALLATPRGSGRSFCMDAGHINGLLTCSYRDGKPPAEAATCRRPCDLVEW